MKKIDLNVYGIVVEVGDPAPKGEGYLGGKIVESDLSDSKESPHIMDSARRDFATALSSLESMILACACAGVDVASPAFKKAIEITVDSVESQFGV